MATIPMRRITAYGGAKEGQGPPVMYFPVAASKTGNPGDVVTISSGAVSFQHGGSATMIGILEEHIPSAKATGTLVPVRLALVGSLYEGSFDAAAAQAKLGGEFPLVSSGTTNPFAVIDADTSSPGVKIIAFIGEQVGVFYEGGFTDKVGNETSPNSNKPYEASCGSFTDTQPRVIFTFPSTYTLWGD